MGSNSLISDLKESKLQGSGKEEESKILHDLQALGQFDDFWIERMD